MIDSGVCTSCKTTYKWCQGRGKMAAACGGSTVDRHLEETILRLPSHLTEMERHRVTANVAMCELFIRRTEDYAKLLRVFIASFAESGTAIQEMLMQEVQELLLNVHDTKRSKTMTTTGTWIAHTHLFFITVLNNQGPRGGRVPHFL